MERFIFKPIGYFYANADKIPRHYSVSEEEGKLFWMKYMKSYL